MYENENHVENEAGNATFVPQRNYTEYQAQSAVFVENPAMTENVGKKKKEKKPKEKKRGGFFKRALLCACLGLFFGVFLGIGFYSVMYATDFPKLIQENVKDDVQASGNNVQYKPEDSQTSIKLTNTESIISVESDITAVVEEVMPAMVSIVNRYTTTGSFFGQTYTEENEASGSGIIVAETAEELLLVTNYHVAASATKLEITFIDGQVAEAKIKGVDSDMDLAVLAVDLEELSADTKKAIAIATWGDSDALRLGEPVIAIGNALGYGQSVTTGIVSALNREITMSDGTKSVFIQTDAAINPGNSGGALLNIRGEVVGINASKIGGSAIEGMGYAIPISAASPIIEELMEHETRKEQVSEEDVGYMGVSLQQVTSQISQAYKMPIGVFVFSVEEGSAAQKAGILPGDVIVKLEGERIETYDDIQSLLRYYSAGDTVKVTIMRQEKGEYLEHVFEVTLDRKNNK
ncbi:MAG: PDZ domain-containing protein [Lachnospiraceae bacterium]|nr:PDZ domain-containing protein [Lachnospiraceae bacterium]